VQRLLQAKATILRRPIAKLINRKTGRIEPAQEWLGHTSTAHTRAYIDANCYREKAIPSLSVEVWGDSISHAIEFAADLIDPSNAVL